MARSRSFDYQVAVQAAQELFWEHGYAAVSLPDLQRATGLSRSSLYAAFGNKRGIYEEAAQSYLRDVIGPLLAPMEVPGSGAAQIAGFFIAMALVMRSPDSRIAKRGCFMLNMLMEVEELDQQADSMVRRYRARVHAAMMNALASMPEVAHRSSRADMLTASHLGIVAMARIDPGGAARASETIAHDVERW
ncbi:TetR/AcrR family transcriptional regulator [Jatrophihabitans telluris]|uniref:TetR/AcrR family transcriptional regulator n=1 Tax=Jatrophihabitans telluris TaxID=2038343 RepID=A0ABY4QVH9_9ACTN|nr:TetR/AcrR family transcriptional regulator [Jatrophihabitans telluris]UQX87102.1 TetR/AcrR family transcriptional regulator [Jatrophihabitans telluris]